MKPLVSSLPPIAQLVGRGDRRQVVLKTTPARCVAFRFTPFNQLLAGEIGVSAAAVGLVGHDPDVAFARTLISRIGFATKHIVRYQTKAGAIAQKFFLCAKRQEYHVAPKATGEQFVVNGAEVATF